MFDSNHLGKFGDTCMCATAHGCCAMSNRSIPRAHSETSPLSPHARRRRRPRRHRSGGEATDRRTYNFAGNAWRRCRRPKNGLPAEAAELGTRPQLRDEETFRLNCAEIARQGNRQEASQSSVTAKHVRLAEEDGIAGVSDDQQRPCLALALWNGRDPILKERLFGLTNSEGNHSEDVKELYYDLDATPT